MNERNRRSPRVFDAQTKDIVARKLFVLSAAVTIFGLIALFVGDPGAAQVVLGVVLTLAGGATLLGTLRYARRRW